MAANSASAAGKISSLVIVTSARASAPRSPSSTECDPAAGQGAIQQLDAGSVAAREAAPRQRRRIEVGTDHTATFELGSFPSRHAEAGVVERAVNEGDVTELAASRLETRQVAYPELHARARAVVEHQPGQVAVDQDAVGKAGALQVRADQLGTSDPAPGHVDERLDPGREVTNDDGVDDLGAVHQVDRVGRNAGVHTRRCPARRPGHHQRPTVGRGRLRVVFAPSSRGIVPDGRLVSPSDGRCIRRVSRRVSLWYTRGPDGRNGHAA